MVFVANFETRYIIELFKTNFTYANKNEYHQNSGMNYNSIFLEPNTSEM